MEPVGSFAFGFYLILAIFLLVLAILWFFLPFAIFGTKNKLDAIIAEHQRTNAALSQLTAELKLVHESMRTDSVVQAPSRDERA